MAKQATILLVGAGAVGSTIAAWVAPYCEHAYVLDQPSVLATLPA